MFRKTTLLLAIVLIFNHIGIAQKCDSTAFLEAVDYQQKSQPKKAIE